MLDMDTWSGPQKAFFLVLVLVCLNYIYTLLSDRISGYQFKFEEGFTATPTVEQIEHTDNTKYYWITDTQQIYDEFYAGVYDQLSNQKERSRAKVNLLRNLWKDKDHDIKEWSVLDIGCGTGWATTEWAKQGVQSVVGLDYCAAMLNRSEKVTVAASQISPDQTKLIRWRQDTMLNPSACSPGEFTHTICFYFTFYYIRDQEEFFRHVGSWTKTGGKLAVEVVNKYKFDPILESASPFVGFSIQKYTNERIRKSRVTFDKFDYEAEFILTDPKAEFYETFRFKNGHVRRQKHEFLMPSSEQVVAYGKRNGWKYIGYQDLNPLGFEYGYLLLFEKL
jgi:SAM-dependent methyltransferase